MIDDLLYTISNEALGLFVVLDFRNIPFLSGENFSIE